MDTMVRALQCSADDTPGCFVCEAGADMVATVVRGRRDGLSGRRLPQLEWATTAKLHVASSDTSYPAVWYIVNIIDTTLTAEKDRGPGLLMPHLLCGNVVDSLATEFDSTTSLFHFADFCTGALRLAWHIFGVSGAFTPAGKDSWPWVADASLLK